MENNQKLQRSYSILEPLSLKSFEDYRCTYDAPKFEDLLASSTADITAPPSLDPHFDWFQIPHDFKIIKPRLHQSHTAARRISLFKNEESKQRIVERLQKHALAEKKFREA